ncbi:MAG: ornithine cyclodeaminase family protein [Burkholderiaceae bacterium]
MRIISADEVHAALPLPALADAIAEALRAETGAPVRHAHAVADDGTLLVMPAWSPTALGVKLVTVMPGNRTRDCPTVQAVYLAFDRATGTPTALIDGEALTLRRTAAASLLAARYLARSDAREVLIIGTGQLVPMMARAHCAERPDAHVSVWGRDAEAAQIVVERLRREGFVAEVTDDLEAAVRAADIVSCATTATQPIVRGAWLQPGVHLDLVGAFKRGMREADDAAIARCRIVVDTYAGALAEAADLLEPLERGVIKRSAIVAELAELVADTQRGRQAASDITLFKSVGTSIEDLAAAQMLLAVSP